MDGKDAPRTFSRNEIYQLIFENPHEAIIFVDTEGRIRLINEGYARFLGFSRESLLGKHIKEAVPQSKIPEVLNSGEAQFGDIWEINGKKVAVSRLPIYKGNKLIGVLGKSLFKDEYSLIHKFMQKVRALENELTYYREELDRQRGARYTIDEIIGESSCMNRLKEKVKKVAATSSTVLITGESGTGKELIAHAIHNASPRRNRPFVRVNCASIPEELLESELFGYEEGSFTGARKGGKPGKFEIARGGTIFLDEVGDMNTSMQAKLLRVLQEKEVERLGGDKPVPVDVRVIAATNKDLETMVCNHQFRADLYYRLNVVLLQIPPLRERKEDIPLLISYLLRKLARRLGAPEKEISAEAAQLFKRYDWPGNVREMENILEQAINLSSRDVLTPADFPALIKRLSGHSTDKPLHLSAALERAEIEAIQNALQHTGDNKKEAARLLGIHRSVLYRKLKKYGFI